jgi:hypothetical protein
MELVKPLALPAEQKVTIRSACTTLAPQDALDRDALRGAKVEGEGAKTLAGRLRAVRKKCIQLALTIDAQPDPAKPNAQRVASPELEVGGASAWLDKAPTPAQIDEHMGKVGLIVLVDADGQITQTDLRNQGRRAAYIAFTAFKDVAPSSCAARLFDLGMMLARKIEREQNVESGSAHQLVAGLIMQGS